MINPCFLNAAMVTDEKQLSSIAGLVHATGTNTGNSYIAYSLYKHLYNGYKEGTIYYNEFWRLKKIDEEMIEKMNTHSHIFLNVQDYIRPKHIHFKVLDWDFLIDFINRLKSPVVISNIGANDYLPLKKDFHKLVPDETIRFLKTLSEHSEYIGVRGAMTQEIMHKLGIDNTIITGCPTYFEMGKNRVIKKYKNVKEKDILTTYPFTMNQSKYPSIAQGDVEAFIMEALTFNENALFKGKINKDVINAYRKHKLHYFTSIKDWKNYASKYKVIAGQRLHGSILGINSGCCPISFVRDIRFKEMYDFFRLPSFNLSQLNSNLLDLYNECDYSEANKVYNSLYDNWVDFIHKNKCLMYWENELANKEENIDFLASAPLYKNKIPNYNFYVNMLDKIWLPRIENNAKGGGLQGFIQNAHTKAHFARDIFSYQFA